MGTAGACCGHAFCSGYLWGTDSRVDAKMLAEGMTLQPPHCFTSCLRIPVALSHMVSTAAHPPDAEVVLVFDSPAAQHWRLSTSPPASATHLCCFGGGGVRGR